MTFQPFNESDRADLSAFVEHILARHEAGTIERGVAAGALVSTMLALGAGDLYTARAWYEEGRDRAARGTEPQR